MITGYTNLAVYMLILTACAILFGKYIVAVYTNKVTFLAPLEKTIYKLMHVNPKHEMTWKLYAVNLILFHIVGIIFLFTLLVVQVYLPLNPEHLKNVPWDLALNTAVSFVTNTNWQSYAGGSTMSYFSQMVGLTVWNFLSAAVGLAVVVSLIRGFIYRESKQIGNFWCDLVKSTLYILLPLALMFSLVLVKFGVPQTLNSYTTINMLEHQHNPPVINNKNISASAKADNTLSTTVITANKTDSTDTNQAAADHNSTSDDTQTIPFGPVASQEAIKLLGTNGGGFFNANSAFPYENPSAISNFLEMLAILLIPAALCFAFGSMVSDKRQGYTIYAVMAIIFIAACISIMHAELTGNPLFKSLNIDQAMNAWQSGGNMEGKEARFGIFGSSMFTAVTTAASCGAVNTMHDSLMPLGGFIPMFLIQLSEIIFGGVGSGLYTMLIFVILAVFIAGLMIGRTPEYLGKKVESFEMKMVAIVILIVPLCVLSGTAISLLLPEAATSISNPSAHGLSQILYAFSSTANNNGSAFAGLSTNTVYYNLIFAFTMLIGRFGVIIPILAIAGNLALKKRIPATSGTMPTHGLLFMFILIGVILIIGALTYVPALALGPIVEHLMLFH